MGVFPLKFTEKSWMRSSSEAVKDVEKKQDEEKSEISGCIKYTIFSINFISFLFLGCGLFGYSVYCLASTTSVYPLETFWDLYTILCVVGVTTGVVSVFGIMGSIRENLQVLNVYKNIIRMMLFGEIIFSIIVLIYIYVPTSRSNIEFFPKKSIWNAMKSYPSSVPSDDFTINSIDILQTTLHCCGVSDDDEGYKDWQEVPQFKCEHSKSYNVFACTVPTSCCHQSKANNASCVDDVLRQRPIDVQDRIYIQGCLKGFHTWIEKNGITVVGIILGILLAQILMLLMTICFTNQIIKQLAKWENEESEIASN